MHEYAGSLPDTSLTVRYCTDEESFEQVEWLHDLIHTCEEYGSPPVISRKIILFSLWDDPQYRTMFKDHKDVKLVNLSCDNWFPSYRRVPNMIKRLYRFKRKNRIIRMIQKWAMRNDSYQICQYDQLLRYLGPDELEVVTSAYLHDLERGKEFDAGDLTDYYFEVFNKKKTGGSRIG